MHATLGVRLGHRTLTRPQLENRVRDRGIAGVGLHPVALVDRPVSRHRLVDAQRVRQPGLRRGIPEPAETHLAAIRQLPGVDQVLLRPERLRPPRRLRGVQRDADPERTAPSDIELPLECVEGRREHLGPEIFRVTGQERLVDPHRPGRRPRHRLANGVHTDDLASIVKRDADHIGEALACCVLRKHAVLRPEGEDLLGARVVERAAHDLDLFPAARHRPRCYSRTGAGERVRSRARWDGFDRRRFEWSPLRPLPPALSPPPAAAGAVTTRRPARPPQPRSRR